MTWQRFVADYGEIITLCAFFSAVLFIIEYSLLAPWWRTSLGQSIVALDSAVALTVAPSVLHFLFGVTSLASEAFAFFTLSAFSAIPLIIIWRGYLLWRLQVHARSHEAQPPETTDKPGGGPLAAESEKLDG